MAFKNTNRAERQAGGRERISLTPETISRIHGRASAYGYDRSAVRPGIVHIGVGNFHRAHEALYVDRCLHLPGVSDWGIIGIGLGDSPAASGKARAISQQDGLYSLTEFAPNGTSATQIIGALLRYIHAPTAGADALAALTAPSTRIVSLTITEGGYNIDEASDAFNLANPDVVADLRQPSQPRTAFGYIVEALERRRAAGLAGFTVLSCDNLRSNGKVAEKAILGFAGARDPELASWIAANVTFPNSMVDRIAPRVDDATIMQIRDLTGIDDRAPVTAESFTQWVVEDRFVAGRPPLEQVGVELRDDVELFEAVKGRLLNASHMMLSYPALMCGYRLVHDALGDPAIRAYLDGFLERDAMPRVSGPQGLSLAAYKDMVLERFANPAIGDQLERIANNGAAKLPVFLTKTLSMMLAGEASFARVALALACFERYLAGSDLQGGPILVNEPKLTAEDRAILETDDHLAILRLSMFKSLRLADDPRMVEAFEKAHAMIDNGDMLGALEHASRA
ncbi:mannitol dehydrogenase family protein [Mesorhizobium sp.]|uniref:mannitol dehydrogenase family protein n=1 Tax=Mesorhizobium sp. TaxID=1871066 RepID=UPI0025FD60EF|nr:mannitol dehydrogenase family protein [Mesorhizobium sp.]